MKRLRYEVQTTWDRMMMPEVSQPLETEGGALLAFDLAVASRRGAGSCTQAARSKAPLRVVVYTRTRRVRRGVERWDLGSIVKEWRNPEVRW